MASATADAAFRLPLVDSLLRGTIVVRPRSWIRFSTVVRSLIDWSIPASISVPGVETSVRQPLILAKGGRSAHMKGARSTGEASESAVTLLNLTLQRIPKGLELPSEEVPFP